MKYDIIKERKQKNLRSEGGLLMDFAKMIIDNARTELTLEGEPKRLFKSFLKVDSLRVNTGDKIVYREVLRKKNVAAVLAITQDERVLLCSQPRAGSNQLGSIEIPAGLVDDGEIDVEAALRELMEETGHKAENVIRLRSFFGDPACCDSKTTLFLATGAEKVAEPRLDADEVLVWFDVSKQEFAEMVKNETICDANSSMAYFSSLEYVDYA